MNANPVTPPADDVWNIDTLRRWTTAWLAKSGSATALQDTDVLLCEVLRVNRLQLLMRFDQPVQKDELTQFKAAIRRRARGEPVAYIVGKKGFYSLDLHVTPAVLIPRPETESLVDAALAFAARDDAPAGPFLDLCTGSGAIALALADEWPRRRAKLPAERQEHAERTVVASDVSPAALDVARGNGQRLSLTVDWRAGDLWQALRPDERFAAVVSNPPYVRKARIATLERDVRDFEPHLALDGGDDGSDLLRKIASGAPAYLLPGGWLGVELGDRAQGEQFLADCADAGLIQGKVEPVQGGPTCVVWARAKG